MRSIKYQSTRRPSSCRRGAGAGERARVLPRARVAFAERRLTSRTALRERHSRRRVGHRRACPRRAHAGGRRSIAQLANPSPRGARLAKRLLSHFAFVSQALNSMQMKDSLRMYNNLVESCFMHCVSSFRSQSLAGDEDECVKKCAEKYIKLTQARRPRVLFLGRPRGAAAAGNLDRPRGAPRPRARVVRGTRRVASHRRPPQRVGFRFAEHQAQQQPPS